MYKVFIVLGNLKFYHVLDYHVSKFSVPEGIMLLKTGESCHALKIAFKSKYRNTVHLSFQPLTVL